MYGFCAQEELDIDEHIDRPIPSITQASGGDFDSVSDLVEEGCASREFAADVVLWMAMATMSCHRYQRISWCPITIGVLEQVEGIEDAQPTDIVPKRYNLNRRIE